MISIGLAWETARAELVGTVFVVVLLFLFLRWLWRRRGPQPYYGQTMGEPAPPAPAPIEPDVPEKMSLGTRLFAIAFFSVWLTVWTAGCYMALMAVADLSYGDEGYIFMRIWLAGAIPAWFFVAWTLFRLLRGDDIEMSFDGDTDGGD